MCKMSHYPLKQIIEYLTMKTYETNPISEKENLLKGTRKKGKQYGKRIEEKPIPQAP